MYGLLFLFLVLPVPKDTIFTGDGTWGPYLISPFLIENSINVTLNDSFVSYTISYDRGILFFNEPITNRDTVRCSYISLPFNLEKQYYKWEESEDTIVVGETVIPPESSDKPEIRFGGEKRFSISLGNRKDFSIDQSTRLSLEGKISEDLRIEGELSDENLPINPQGTTQELADFESAYIKVRGKNTSLLLGDIDLSFAPNIDYYQPIQRKVEGINFKFDKGNYSYDATVSLAKGIRKKIRFEGNAGKQGPYILSRKRAIVLSSERVYVDSRELKRGKEYLIDYASAELEFNSIFPISGGEEILVYFEETNGDYRREIYGLEASMIGDLTLNIGFFRESDNGKHPTTFVLSEEEKKIIASSTDSIVWLPGSRYVGKNNSDYVIDDSIFIFVGYKEGSWDVKFSEVENGDYEYNNLIGGFEFVGKEEGRFIPYIPIPIPCAHTLSTVSLNKKFGNSSISVDGLFSINDINSLRGGDESLGSNGNLSYASKGKIYEFKASVWSASDKFFYPDRREEWGRGYGVKLGFTPKMWFLFNGYIEGGDSHRGNIGLRVGSDKKGIEYRWNREVRFTETHFKGYYGIKYFLPYVVISEIERELLKSNLYGAGLEIDKFSLEVTEETRDTMSSGWQIFETTRNAKLRFHPTNLDLNLFYKQGKRWGEDFSLLLGKLSGFLGSRYVNLHLMYDLSRKEKTLYEEIFYEVEEGKGNYSRDPITGKYYPDEYGNYERRLIPRSSPQLVNQFFFQHIINLLPTEDTKITIKTIKSGEGDRISFWTRVPGISDKNHFSISASVKSGLFTTYYSQQDIRDGKTVGHTKQRQVYLLEAGINPYIYGFPLSLEYSQENSSESYLDGEMIAEETMKEVKGRIYHSFKSTKISFTTTVGEQRIKDFLYSVASPLLKLRYLKFSPVILYRRDNKEILINAEITDRKEIDGKASCAMKALYPTGISYLLGLSLTIKPKGNIHYIIDYEGRKREEYPFDHTMKVEARMFF